MIKEVRKMAKRRAKAILLDSDFSGREVSVSIDSGFTKVDIDKTLKFDFFTDRTKPIKVFRDGLFQKDISDFYIFSWKSLIPLEFELRQELWKKDEIYERMRNNNFTEEEIERFQKDAEKKEKEGYNMDYFVFKTLEPVEIGKQHWTKTELPAIIRDTVDMRFLKALKTYTEGTKGGIGKGVVIVFIIIFMVLVLAYAYMSGGVIKLPT
jgi:hypothetical protein